ncbi:RNase P/MRP, p29 subunit [Neolentinus lepideus HHB14362 ss-1]|uniref:RNase P/MRP, p29 subunit n=1 Tax=Neolentinus lepideus HHB14362 ss-1 TaxID=1314782 RepID=A0A165QGT3_9AGAM|nr:RNase P/MRP, p29 subunit [Neolentinus lepideus HHB14362 ss-1]
MQTSEPITIDISAVVSTSRPKPPVNPYAPLPLPPRNARITLTSASPFTPTYVQSHLRTSDPAGTYASRISGKQIMLENPAKESKAKKEREEKKRRRKEAKKKKGLGVGSVVRGSWKLNKEQSKFELFLPLHHMWLGYMSELHNLPPPSHSAHTPNVPNMHGKLVKADFHGSYITVCQAKNPALVGSSGIVILETENAFRVINKKNQVKLLPKQNSIFKFCIPLYSTLFPGPSSSASQDPALPASRLESHQTVQDIPHLEFELYGNQFCFRSAERAAKKFKAKESIEL